MPGLPFLIPSLLPIRMLAALFLGLAMLGAPETRAQAPSGLSSMVELARSQGRAVIGAQGGWLGIETPGHPLRGVRVEIEPGAIEEEGQAIGLGFGAPPAPLNEATGAAGAQALGPALLINRSSARDLAKPARITMSLPKGARGAQEGLRAWRWDEPAGVYRELAIEKLEAGAERVSFLSPGSGWFVLTGGIP